MLTLQASSARRLAAHKRDALHLYGVYRAYIIHEDTLISQRTQRMLLVQGTLFTAWGAMFGKVFGDIEPALLYPDCCQTVSAHTLLYGISLAAITTTGILAAHLSRGALRAAADAVDLLDKKWLATNELWKSEGLLTAEQMHLPGLRGGGARKVHDKGQLHILLMPIYLMTLWTVLLIALIVVACKLRHCF